MSTDEIYDIITSDLNVDAYQYQDTNHIRYSGDALAEGLENLTYLCPICKRFDTIHTKGNKIWCDCGMKATFDGTVSRRNGLHRIKMSSRKTD